MKRFLKCCSLVIVLGALVLIIGYVLFAPRVSNLLTELFASPTPPPTSGLPGYLVQPGDLPEGTRVLQYQEVPHPECTDYAVSYMTPDGLQVYSKICCSASPLGVADLSLQWADTVRVDAPTVGQESMAFHGPVIGKPAVSVSFVQGQCSGMVQVIGKEDEAATGFAVSLARSMVERVPLSVVPTLTGTQRAECYKTMELIVSNSDFGEPVSMFHGGEDIYAMVIDPIECGQATVRLVDSGGKTLLEKTYSVAGGMNGYGDYNAAQDLAAGEYKMELWFGEMLLKTKVVTVE